MAIASPAQILPGHLVRLARHRWTVPLLAMLGQQDGGRFAELLHALGLPRDSLVRTLDAAIAAGWVERCGGHGHPLRPEYRLTPSGSAQALTSAAICAVGDHIGVAPAAMARWTLPVAGAVALGHSRFVSIAHCLEVASPRGLALSLKAMQRQSLLTRTVEPHYPPVPRYMLTAGGQQLAAAALA